MLFYFVFEFSKRDFLHIFPIHQLFGFLNYIYRKLMNYVRLFKKKNNNNNLFKFYIIILSLIDTCLIIIRDVVRNF